MQKEYMSRSAIALPLVLLALAGCAKVAPEAVNHQPQAGNVASPAVTSVPLSAAVRDAVVACMAVDAATIDGCGSMPGRSPAHTTARTAVRAAYEARDAFVNQCHASLTLERCTAQAEMHIVNGYALVQ